MQQCVGGVAALTSFLPFSPLFFAPLPPPSPCYPLVLPPCYFPLPGTWMSTRLNTLTTTTTTATTARTGERQGREGRQGREDKEDREGGQEGWEMCTLTSRLPASVFIKTFIKLINHYLPASQSVHVWDSYALAKVPFSHSMHSSACTPCGFRGALVVCIVYIHMVYIWCTYGVYMVYVWCIHAVFMQWIYVYSG